MELFGWKIQRKKEEEQNNYDSFVPPKNEDGALVVQEGGVFGTYVDLNGAVRSESELVTKYRTIAADPIVDQAIAHVVNDAIVEDAQEDTVSINLDNLEVKDNIKERIIEEFNNVLNLLEFNNQSYEIFKQWYIDGRLYYHTIIDEKTPRQGIKELRYIDPRHIKKIRVVSKDKNIANVTKKVDEYYMYSAAGFNAKTAATGVPQNIQGLKIAKDAITYCTSGYSDPDGKMILSYLHKSIRPVNMLRAMEDSLVIYRISRAPERRIFYVDVGGLPTAKAEQHVRDLMTRFKNKVVYDSETGQIKDDRKFMTMLEDFWLPRREGRGTEITTLPGGQNLSDIDDVLYFQNILYKSLNIPTSRLQQEATFNFGRSTEISREEINFAKFITRLRFKFSDLFMKLLEKQLLLTGVCNYDDWYTWRNDIVFDYAIDNYFEELKTIEIARERLNITKEIDDYIGKYYSHNYVRKYFLKQTDQEMKLNDDQIEEEKKSGKYSDEDFDPSDTNSTNANVFGSAEKPRRDAPKDNEDDGGEDEKSD